MASISGNGDRVVVMQASKSSIDIATYLNELEAAKALIYKYAAAWPVSQGDKIMEDRLNAISLAVAKTLASFCEDYEVLRTTLCEDCPPDGYPTDETRCAPCPRSSNPTAVFKE